MKQVLLFLYFCQTKLSMDLRQYELQLGSIQQDITGNGWTFNLL
jgi:hypothetical protein